MRQQATCINISVYPEALTYGKKYTILAIDALIPPSKIKIRTDSGKNRWFPINLFDLSGNDTTHITQIVIEDEIDNSTAAVEVSIELSNGERRHCIFARPELLHTFGDILPLTNTRIHYGQNFIILSNLTIDTIHRALEYLLIHNELTQHSLLIDTKA